MIGRFDGGSALQMPVGRPLSLDPHPQIILQFVVLRHAGMIVLLLKVEELLKAGFPLIFNFKAKSQIDQFRVAVVAHAALFALPKAGLVGRPLNGHPRTELAIAYIGHVAMAVADFVIDQFLESLIPRQFLFG